MTDTIRIDDHDVFLVVDVQNDFCPGGNLAVPRGHEVVPLINMLAGKFAHVVLTQDWHPHGHLSFASSHSGKKNFRRSRHATAHRFYGPTIVYRELPVPHSGMTWRFLMPSWSCARDTIAKSTPIPHFTKTIAKPGLDWLDIYVSAA